MLELNLFMESSFIVFLGELIRGFVMESSFIMFLSNV